MGKIISSLHQKNKPDAVLTDSRGTVIKIGSRVAFNRSGNVLIGYLRDFKAKWKEERKGVGDKKWWRLYVTAKIQNEPGGDEVVFMSTISNINSFVIIN